MFERLEKAYLARHKYYTCVRRNSFLPYSQMDEIAQKIFDKKAEEAKEEYNKIRYWFMEKL